MSFTIDTNITRRGGFTLVEIMIVVVIIGLLSALALPAINRARVQSNASRLANDFRVFATAFETHCLESGSWAPDGNGNNLPQTVFEHLEGTAWFQPPPGGGYWDWEFDRLGYTAAIGLALNSDWPEVMLRVDQILDDGELASGNFVQVSNRYLYVLE